jgi:hypothetical protein
MVKCDFPNCPADEAMPFRCDRCDPPKYYCNKHRLPPSHNCLGITDWTKTKSPVTDISIGYEKTGLTKVVGGSGYLSGIDNKTESGTTASTDAIWFSPKTPNNKLKTQPWYSKIKNGIINFYNTHFKK